jgi:anti-sigma factor RsiW
MMNCQNVELLLMEYVSGELDVVTCAVIGEHLAQCESCSRELDREKTLAETLGGLPVVKKTAPDVFVLPAQRRQWWSAAGVSLATAAVLLVIFISGKTGFETKSPEPGQRELAAATEDVRWTLSLANKIIRQNEKETLEDLFGTKLLTAISGSLFLSSEPENGNKS